MSGSDKTVPLNAPILYHWKSVLTKPFTKNNTLILGCAFVIKGGSTKPTKFQ